MLDLECQRLGFQVLRDGLCWRKARRNRIRFVSSCVCYVLGKRQEKMMLNFQPYLVSTILLGTVLMWWDGWLSTVALPGTNLKVAIAYWNSSLADTMGVISWY